ncbi:hypothetical protein FXB38_16445 [Bradyrhizobium cytisi]|uniref:DUF680 domain-containing protein n=1 Tax=Bradyrhizobium cytisi TaxID=515489 RepID=A0A5S4WPN9_9BRAD|nr:hypothetical protein FXB38_16445 [Bradyrhizobium cytisi]
MKYVLMLGLALIALCGAVTFAEARPPTVTNSPGYDARLKESRSALGNPPTVQAPGNPPVTSPKHSRKKHTN